MKFKIVKILSKTINRLNKLSLISTKYVSLISTKYVCLKILIMNKILMILPQRMQEG